MAFAQFAFEKALGVTDPVQPKMADIGLGGNEYHRDAVPDLPLAELCLDDHQRFIGRAKAGRALHGADDYRAGIAAEGFKGRVGTQRVIDMADRLGIPFRAEAFDFIKRQFRAGGDDKIVIVHEASVTHSHTPGLRLDALGLADNQVDVALFHRACEIHHDVFPVTPADKHPGV